METGGSVLIYLYVSRVLEIEFYLLTIYVKCTQIMIKYRQSQTILPKYLKPSRAS